MHADISRLIERYKVAKETIDFLNSPQRMLISGRWVDSENEAHLDVFEPFTGEKLSSVPDASFADLNSAVAAAQSALKGEWAKATPVDRQNCMLRLADLMVEHKQILGEIETLDNGKALLPCIDYDVLGSVEVLRYMAGFATKRHGRTHDVSTPGNSLAFTVAEPIGVVGAIVPWNWPIAMATWKLAAPLAAGCTVVIKPASETSLSLLYLGRLIEMAGFPAGTINIITGSGSRLGDAFVAHPGIDKVSFTGSTQVGRQVGKIAGHSLKPATLELGGKSPMVVFADADLAAVVEGVMGSVFFNSGQVCSAGSRLYAHKSIIDELSALLSDMVATLKIGPGLDPDCYVGPVINKRAQNSIQGYVDRGLADGARLVCSGRIPEEYQNACFVPPMVLKTDDNKAEIVQEEIFGPVLTLIPFSDEADVLQKANDGPYGLGASVWTKDINRAMRFLKGLDAGTVWVNAHDLGDASATFGGFKESGFGKDLGVEQFEHYLKMKEVWIAHD